MIGMPGSAPLDEEGLRRIRAVTLHFTELQGLRNAVPMGLYFTGFGIQGLAGRAGGVLASLLFIACAGLLRSKASRFYRKRFGEVEALGAQETWESALAVHGPRYFGGVEGPLSELSRLRGRLSHHRRALLGLARRALLGLAAFSVYAGVLLLPPEQMLWLSSGGISVFLLWYWHHLEMGVAQLYYPVLALLLLVFALVSDTAVAAIPVWIAIPIWNLRLGTVLILIGLFDHRLLTRILPPAPPDLETDAAQEEP